nr:hypothetical protein [Ancylobacter sp. Lp-2]
MPEPPAYPGVYVDEIASGACAILGVPTSIAAIVGRFPRGPVNEPVRVFSAADFEPLWAQLRLTVGTFLHSLFQQGAFQGASPHEAYFVACDATTTTRADMNDGVVNMLVGFAPLKPAEFVTLAIRQACGPVEEPYAAGSPPVPPRTDPYRSFRFRLRVEGAGPVAGAGRMAVVNPPVGLASRWRRLASRLLRSPVATRGRTLTFERGLTCDADFAQMGRRHHPRHGKRTPQPDRRDPRSHRHARRGLPRRRLPPLGLSGAARPRRRRQRRRHPSAEAGLRAVGAADSLTLGHTRAGPAAARIAHFFRKLCCRTSLRRLDFSAAVASPWQAAGSVPAGAFAWMSASTAMSRSGMLILAACRDIARRCPAMSKPISASSAPAIPGCGRPIT